MFGRDAPAHDRHMPNRCSPQPRRTRRGLLLVTALVVFGCTSGPSAADGAERLIGTNSSSGTPASSDLTSSAARPVDRDERSVEITYDDVAGRARTIRAELRLPPERVSTPTPVVVWSHGGSTGFRHTDHVGDRWGRAMNAGGVAFIAIAHPARRGADHEALCAALDAADCSMLNPLLWDRPHDVRAALDWIEEIADQHQLDREAIVVAGHSAGARSSLHVAGMAWSSRTAWNEALTPPIDPRPVAFLASSPPDAMAIELMSNDLQLVDRPMLLLSGAGDDTRSSSAEGRRAIFQMIPTTTEAAMLWIDRHEATHGLFDLNRRACDRAGGDARNCRLAARTIARVGVRFVLAATEPGSRFDAERFADSTAAGLAPWASVTSSTR